MDAQNPGEHDLTLNQVVAEIMTEVHQALDRHRVTVLREAVAVLVAAAPPLNSELRHDGTADPLAAAYVEGFHDAWSALQQLLHPVDDPPAPIGEQVMPMHWEDANQYGPGRSIGTACKGATTPGYVQEIDGGQVHCNVCGWVTSRG